MLILARTSFRRRRSNFSDAKLDNTNMTSSADIKTSLKNNNDGVLRIFQNQNSFQNLNRDNKLDENELARAYPGRVVDKVEESRYKFLRESDFVTALADLENRNFPNGTVRNRLMTQHMAQHPIAEVVKQIMPQKRLLAEAAVVFMLISLVASNLSTD